MKISNAITHFPSTLDPAVGGSVAKFSDAAEKSLADGILLNVVVVSGNLVVDAELADDWVEAIVSQHGEKRPAGETPTLLIDGDLTVNGHLWADGDFNLVVLGNVSAKHLSVGYGTQTTILGDVNVEGMFEMNEGRPVVVDGHTSARMFWSYGHDPIFESTDGPEFKAGTNPAPGLFFQKKYVNGVSINVDKVRDALDRGEQVLLDAASAKRTDAKPAQLNVTLRPVQIDSIDAPPDFAAEMPAANFGSLEELIDDVVYTSSLFLMEESLEISAAALMDALSKLPRGDGLNCVFVNGDLKVNGELTLSDGVCVNGSLSVDALTVMHHNYVVVRNQLLVNQLDLRTNDGVPVVVGGATMNFSGTRPTTKISQDTHDLNMV